MSTVAQIIDRTLLQLGGYSISQDQSTALAVSVNDDDTTITVVDATQLSRGQAEIDQEIVFIESVDRASNTATITRGFRSTVAAQHIAPTRVTMSPMFYRSTVMQALNEAVAGVYPILFGVATTTFTTSGSQTTYSLPAGAESVLEVKWRNVGPTQEWSQVRRWAVDSQANTTYFPTGASLSIWDGVPSGRTVQVTYSKVPVIFTAETDDFSISGLPASSEDVIRLAIMWRLVPMLETPHFAGLSAEADLSANQRQVGGAITAARFFMQQYQVRLSDEASRLSSLYPIRVHYTS